MTDARTVNPGHAAELETPAERVARIAPFQRHAYEPADPGGAWCGRCGKAARVGLHHGR